MSNGRTSTHVDEHRHHRVLPLPDTPLTVTLTYRDGRTVSLDLQATGDPVKGVVWGEAVQEMYDHQAVEDVEWRPPDDERELAIHWIARTHNSDAATICRWEDGHLICS